ncbi:bone morphogenetic protein 7-like [Centruroides sculpturatus]|uniref:bone morphogenetic protein 7-like n=1 Tax=Centruroides sculpturatus TaxID=218467 RepID=UPI000C6E6204|nr:bone morphogenetic protein 7-like [Centruroides sculpturatus]
MFACNLIILIGVILVSYNNAMVLNADDGLNDELAIHRLLQVFGIEHLGQRERHHSPPEYMLDLYNAIADSSGITRTPNPYYATIVRSFPDKGEWSINCIKVVTVIKVRVYQVMSADNKYKETGNKILDVRRISAHSYGWEVFYVKPAVLDWLKDETQNFGLLVTVKTIMGTPITDGTLRFAKRHQHHINKQPILVLFSDDGKSKQKSSFPQFDFHNYGYPELSYYSQLNRAPTNKELPINNSTSNGRLRRSTEDNVSEGCSRHELYVDFEKIGWSTWIISPKGYNAYHCKGECLFPLGQNQWPTNHATVQSIVHQLSLTAGVDTPCCVPNKLYSISLLYFDEHENVILKQYDDMVAASCGCH